MKQKYTASQALVRFYDDEEWRTENLVVTQSQVVVAKTKSKYMAQKIAKALNAYELGEF